MKSFGEILIGEIDGFDCPILSLSSTYEETVTQFVVVSSYISEIMSSVAEFKNSVGILHVLLRYALFSSVDKSVESANTVAHVDRHIASASTKEITHFFMVSFVQSRNWGGSYTATVAAVPFIRQEITPHWR